MKLYYWQGPKGNFGDDLNPWLWDKLLPGCFDSDASKVFFGIGTILGLWVPDGHKIVFGSGCGYVKPPKLDDSWQIYCVRGPLTASALGIDKNLAITDPASLLATLGKDELPSIGKRIRIGFAPHHRDMEYGVPWQWLCSSFGIELIDPYARVEETLTQIRGCELILAEAMHAAIVADAFRIPWIPVSLFRHILDFKWHDWCASMNLTYKPHIIRPLLRPEPGPKERIVRMPLAVQAVARLRWTAANAEPVLSNHETLTSHNARLIELLERFRQAHLQ
jgi:succinoglycan biosynthesis protein ExoV